MKQPSAKSIERVAQMTFASIYPLYLARLEKNGRTKKELHEVIKWLTGYDEKKLKKLGYKENRMRAAFVNFAQPVSFVYSCFEK